MPKLSIITINYNNCKGLQTTIQSVISQSFTDYEYILVDGGSSDGSLSLIEQYKDHFAWSVTEKDGGIYDAMNKGIDRSKGEYTMFLNSGDYLLDENVLSDFSNVATEHYADIYYGNILLEEPDTSVKHFVYPTILGLEFWEHYTINHQAAFIKRSLFTDVTRYDTNFTLAADYAFFLKCFIHGKKFLYINRELVYFRYDGTSSENKSLYRQQMHKAWKIVTPQYLRVLYEDSRTQNLFMQHRLMKLAKALQHRYTKFKKNFQ